VLTEEVQMGSPEISLRPGPAGDVAVRAVGALDGSQASGADVLAGELNGEIVAVIRMRDGIVAAHPFRPTAAVVASLKRHRAMQLARQ
jgi:hypothetical protein